MVVLAAPYSLCSVPEDVNQGLMRRDLRLRIKRIEQIPAFSLTSGAIYKNGLLILPNLSIHI